MKRKKLKKRETRVALPRKLPQSFGPSRPAPTDEENQHTAAKKYYRDMERVARIVRALHDKQKPRLRSMWNSGMELEGGPFDAEILHGNSALELLQLHIEQAIAMQAYLVENVERSANLLRSKITSRRGGA